VVQNKAGPYFYCDDCTPQKWLAVLDQTAKLKPRIIVPDHSDVGDGSLIAQEHDMIAFLLARIQALKAAGDSQDQATWTLTTEVHDKYPGWTGFTYLDPVVQKVYAANP
jgi:hypothetical protein